MFKPHADRLLVKLIPKKGEKSVIITVGKQEDKGYGKGRVLAHGPGTAASPLECKVGDVVYFTKCTKFEETDEDDLVIVFNSVVAGRD